MNNNGQTFLATFDFSKISENIEAIRTKREAEEAREREAAELLRRRKLWKEALETIPEIYKETLAGSLDCSGRWGYAYDLARAWIKESGFISIVGPTGVGKSTMAAALCREACLTLGYSVEWYRMDSLLLQIQQTFTARRNDEYRRWNTQMQAIDNLCRPKLLIMDDFNNRTDWAEQTIYEILSKRYETGSGSKKRITIITSNRQGTEFDGLFRLAMADRIRACKHMIEFNENTPSRR